jgi:serine/threonine protein kinase
MKREGRQTFVGTPCWMAPEVMEQVHGYDYKADIWSLGITALELARGQAPLAQYPPMRVLLLTLQNPPPSLDNTFTKPFQNFVETCLQKDPSKGPTASKLLEHKFLKQARKVDFVAQSLLKDLPPLWERVKLNIMLPEEEKDSGGSAASSWNFENGELLETIVQNGTSPNDSPCTSVTASGGSSAQSGTQGESGNFKDRVVKGRFTKTVISKVSNTSLNTKEEGEEQDKGNQRLSGKIDPLYLLTELQRQIVSLMKENETLKAQNSQLRKELQAKSQT